MLRQKYLYICWNITRLKSIILFNRVYRSLSNKYNSVNFSLSEAHTAISRIHSDNGSICAFYQDKKTQLYELLEIIIPVYNIEKYLRDCLDSIVNQVTKINFIIHIIDDGSTDLTLSIANEYAKKYSNIKVTHQENSSQSVARNNALDQCDTEWVMMVDGDDILPDGAIETLMDIAINQDCDIVEGRVDMFYGQWSPENQPNGKVKVSVYNSTQSQDFALTSRGYSCGKVYRRSLWNGVRYPVRYIFEDIITRFVICRKAQRYAYTNSVVYGYRMHSGSSSHSGGMRKLDCLWVMEKVQSIRQMNHIPNDRINHLLLMNHFAILVPNMVSNLDAEAQQAAITIAKDYLNTYNVDKRVLPYFYRKAHDAIMKRNVALWLYVCRFILKNRLISKYREQ